MHWERRRILIWGKTRPELSKTYCEIVCTGGVFEDTKRLVRLYPIPLRFMDDEHLFAKYQWIEADICRPTNDSRPESWRVRFDSISVGEKVSTDDAWRERSRWVLHDENVFRSVEHLQERQAQDGTSLGLIEPAEIIRVDADVVPPRELAEFYQRYKEASAQLDLALDPQREIEPLTPSDYRFRITFRCADPACKSTHTFSVLDWEIDALYFRMSRKKPSHHAAAQEVRTTLERLCGKDHDARFFLGNISSHPKVFTIVGLWYPKRSAQLGLTF